MYLQPATPDQLTRSVYNRNALEQLARENVELISRDPILARSFQSSFKYQLFGDQDLGAVVALLNNAKADQNGASAPAKMPAAPTLEKPIATMINLVKPVNIIAPVPVVPIASEAAAVKIMPAAGSSSNVSLVAPAMPPAVMPSAPVSGASKWFVLAGGLFLLYKLARLK